MKQLPTNKRIFSDVTAVSRGAAIILSHKGMTDDNSIVVPWVYLNNFMRDKTLSDKEAKQLILLELYRTDEHPVRYDIVDRLVLYLSAINKHEVRKKIEQTKKSQ